MAVIVRFILGFFGKFWPNLGAFFLKLLMGPVAFYLFGPLFRLSGYIAGYILDQIQPYLGDVGVTVDSLAAWFIQVLRIQECVTSLITFLIMGFTLSLIKKVF